MLKPLQQKNPTYSSSATAVQNNDLEYSRIRVSIESLAELVDRLGGKEE